jgi:uracil-DNA glycosylase
MSSTNILNNVNLEEVKLKLYERLKESEWAPKLRTFILSDAFDSILIQLLKEAKAGNRFTPPLKNVFKAFTECPYKDLKVVLIGQDPYPYANVADGIAFSAKDAPFVPPSLRFIFREIETTVYPEGGYIWNPDLTRWSNQGILMINTAFTTTVGKVGVHYELWKPFIGFLLDILGSYNPGLIYVFIGNKAKSWSDLVPESNHKLYAIHPAAAAHTLKELWDSDNLFNKISHLMMAHYKHKMIW